MNSGVPCEFCHLRSKVLHSHAESLLMAGHGSSQMPGANNVAVCRFDQPRKSSVDCHRAAVANASVLPCAESAASCLT